MFIIFFFVFLFIFQYATLNLSDFITLVDIVGKVPGIPTTWGTTWRLTWRDSHSPVRVVTKHSGLEILLTFTNLDIIVYRSRNSFNSHISRFHQKSWFQVQKSAQQTQTLRSQKIKVNQIIIFISPSPIRKKKFFCIYIKCKK